MGMLTMLTVSMMAVPANRKSVKVTQPDGSTVTIQLQGDEWQHFNTTTDGYSVVKNQQGYYVYAEKKNGDLKATQMVAHNVQERKTNELVFLQNVKKYQVPDMAPAVADMKGRVEAIGAQRRAQGNRATNYSNFKGLIVLIQYNDKEFSREDYPTIINDMVNQQNYTGYDNNQRTGSVRDYFTDNSGGKFQPQFDVVGPYTVDYSQYDANMKNGKCRKILIDALNQADADVNFKNYDGDNDGKVDLVFFIVAGNGANYSGNDENLWWPHRSMIFDDEKYNTGKSPYLYKDGVLLWDYASSTELCGYTNNPQSVFIDGIGTICHEFSHVLGLPDFYDSDYEENGKSVTPGDWSLMDSGCYLNNGFTPVGYSLYERYLVGFTDKPEIISQAGNYTLEPLFSNQKGYWLNTPKPKEFFLLENRQRNQFKWDAYLPGDGMLVHRVDRSDEKTWQSNKVNATPEHNYYVLLRAGGETTSSASDPFPGKKNVYELTNESLPANLKTWNGTTNDWAISNISMNNGIVTFNVSNYDVVGLAIEPAVLEELPIGVTKQLKVVVTPVYAANKLMWLSDDKAIVTVDQNGVVKGISKGTTTIRVQSDNDIEATCQITVKDMSVCSIADFKQRELGSTMLLNLTDAEVLYVYQNDAYVRGATGCIILDNEPLQLKKNDRVNGTIIAMLDSRNKMPLAMSTEGTNADALSVTAGSDVQPHEVTIDELTEADYCDYVLVKAGKLKADGGVWVVNGQDEKMARLWNAMKITGISLKDYNGNYYDIPAIYGTDVVGGNVINELYMLKTPTKVEAPTGIMQIVNDQDQTANSPIYNMAGQRVNSAKKGLYIVNGSKVVIK